MANVAAFVTVKDWADLLHAVAWPIVVLIAIYLFRKSIDHAIRDVINRIPWERTSSLKARGLGEVTIRKKAEQRIAATVKIPPQIEPRTEGEKSIEQFEQAVLEQAAISPKAAIMLSAIAIESELRKILASTGALKRFLSLQQPTLPNALKVLGTVSGATIPKELEEKISQFWHFRNQTAHQGVAEVPLYAIELGLSILRILRNVPRPSYIVEKANVPLYSDSDCRNERPDVRGVLIETFDADGKSQGTRIYPSTKKYAEGMSLSWEWDTPIAYRSDMGWEATWYKDTETGKCTPSWSESLEFIGREINEV